MDYKVFISYRREGGEFLGKILYDKLSERGYNTFYDVESIRRGKFNEQIYSVIDECDDFIILLSPDSLDRCIDNPEDWVRLELTRAIEKGKNVIPVMLRGFNWPENLPEPLDQLPNFEGLSVTNEYFDAFVDRLCALLVNDKCDERKKSSDGKRKRAAVIAVIAAAALLLGGGLVFFLTRAASDNPYLQRTAETEEPSVTDYLPSDITVSADTLKLVSAESEEDYSTDNDWGDEQGGREVYTSEDVSQGALGDKIVFNSVTDGKVGDERKFVGAKLSDSETDEWTNDTIEVSDGEVYTVCMYVHNDNPNGLNAIAEDARISFSMPTSVSYSHTFVGYIDSSNASHGRCWDTVTFKSDEPFFFEYIENSAKYTNDSMGTIGLGNDAILSGVPIGYDRFDGKIPGGSKYAGVATIEVVVHKSVNAKLKLFARVKGTKHWEDDKIDANIGDTVEFQIEYENLLGEQVNNVMIRDMLPTNTEYIENSTILYNTHYPDGVQLKDNTVATSGINIGSYIPEGNAYIRFSVRIVDRTLGDGLNQLVNWAASTVNEAVSKDDVSIIINKR